MKVNYRAVRPPPANADALGVSKLCNFFNFTVSTLLPDTKSMLPYYMRRYEKRELNQDQNYLSVNYHH